MSIVTEFQPPEGLHAHEAVFLAGIAHERDDLFPTALAAACLEIADMGLIAFDPARSKWATRIDVPGAATVPYQEKMLSVMTGGQKGIENLKAWEDLVWSRLADGGFAEPGTRKRTAKGEEARAALLGYRSYLAQAMTDRVHAAAIEGRVDRETQFAVALGVMSLPNAWRAYSIKLGARPEGFTGALFDVLGGKATEQHAYSYKSGAMKKGCMTAYLLAIAAFIALFALIWAAQTP